VAILRPTLDADRVADAVLAVFFTAWSAWRTVLHEDELTRTFLYGQVMFDMLVVTAVVHVTGRQDLSYFAALYVVVNMSAAFLLPIGGALLIATLGAVLYAADVLWWSQTVFSLALLLQVSVFIVAALATSVIGSRLQQIGASSRQLAGHSHRHASSRGYPEQHPQRHSHHRHRGALMYANPAASELLGVDLQSLDGRRRARRDRGASPGLSAPSSARFATTRIAAREVHVTLAIAVSRSA